jgi:methylglutaconyl-CoA hydratase
MDGDNKYKGVSVNISTNIATVTLNRPEKHNAFDEEMLSNITQIFEDLGSRDEIRIIVLTGTGPSFCAGADLEWMRRVATFDRDQNLVDAERLATMFYTIYHCPKPVVAKVNGNVMGGGAGMVASCDIAIAARDSMFAFPEVKLGIIPAVISPYVIEKIGIAKTKELFITGEKFDAQKAYEIGLVSQLVVKEELDAAVEKKVKFIMSSGPNATSRCKELVRGVSKLGKKEAIRYTAVLIADLRATPEGKEGMEAFLQKRKASWCK